MYDKKLEESLFIPGLWNHHALNTRVINVALLIHCQSLQNL